MTDSQFLLEETQNPWSLLPANQWQNAVDIRDYMLGSGRVNPNPTETLRILSEMIVGAGVPLDRCVTIVGILHAESVASVRMWESDNKTSEFTFPYAESSAKGYETSPSALAHRTRSWVRFRPQELADETFGLIPELKQTEITDYICAPVFLVNGMENVFTFATKNPSGFSSENISFLRVIFPAIAACQEILVTHRMLKEVTRMYVGEEPHKRILAGDVHRGEVTRIQSAILFADMRDFTSLTAKLSAEEATELLNDYYDCIVPPIESNGGEVLKYIGDGVLAIFRAEGRGNGACTRAIEAPNQGLGSVHSRVKSPEFEVGIALHFGEVAYGNVGSGERLDYTVIGSDVNLASRVAGMCGTLKEPLLVTEAFHQLCSNDTYRDCGTHNLKGIEKTQTIFATPTYPQQ